MNLATSLLAPAEATPDAPALRAGDAAVTHGGLAARAGRVAELLGDAGERVAILAGNEVEFVAAYLAVLASGRVAVPLDPTAPAPEVKGALDGVGADVVVASPGSADLARSVSDGRPVVVLDGLGVADPTPDVAPPSCVPRSADDLAVLLFTSGTAGRPHAAMLTHGSLGANLAQVGDHAGLRLHADDVALGLLPFHHVFGLNVVLGLALASGGSVVLVDRFEPAGSLALLADAGITVVAAVPAVFQAWLDLPDADPGAFAGVRLAVSGAATLPVEVAAGLEERFGVEVFEGYGLTEASPIVTTAAGAGAPRRGSVGPPLPGVEVRLVDTDGADVLAGDPGEVWVRGANVFAGYWDDSEASARVLDGDGWLHTGDIAVADDDGWLRIVDRAKDLVIVSGFNVFPAEVEDALAEVPGIAEAAVVGEPDARTGETVVAWVVPSAGATVTAEGVVADLAGRLARYKVPTRVEIVDSLPRTVAGKILRRELRNA